MGYRGVKLFTILFPCIARSTRSDTSPLGELFLLPEPLVPSAPAGRNSESGSEKKSQDCLKYSKAVLNTDIFGLLLSRHRNF